jgi:hypothetical protein
MKYFIILLIVLSSGLAYSCPTSIPEPLLSSIDDLSRLMNNTDYATLRENDPNRDMALKILEAAEAAYGFNEQNLKRHPDVKYLCSHILKGINLLETKDKSLGFAFTENESFLFREAELKKMPGKDSYILGEGSFWMRLNSLKTSACSK